MNRRTIVSTLSLAALGGALALVGCAPPPGGLPQAPTDVTAPAYLEVWGSRSEATVSTMTDAYVSNTVALPHRQALPEGYVRAGVTAMPSVDDYINGAGNTTGEVGCRIVRAGAVVDEQSATGQFTNVSCEKWR